MKNILIDLSPPIMLRFYRQCRSKLSRVRQYQEPKPQDLDIYWTKQMADLLETWGGDGVWPELQLIMCGGEGNTLDIACGTLSD
jgi:hypothetical protein